MNSLFRTFIALLASLQLIGCSQQEPARIGFLLELSGRSGDLGEAARNGAILAIEQLKSHGKLGERKIELLIRDIQSDPNAARKAAEELVNAKVDIIVGPITTVMADAILPVTEKAGIVLLAPSVSATRFFGKDDYFFRLNWTARDEGKHYAQHYFKNRKLHTVSIAANGNNRGHTEDWANGFRDEFESLGGKVLALRFFDSFTSNLSPIVSELLQPSPDALLFVCAGGDATRLAQQAFKQKPGIAMITLGWAATSQLIEQGGQAVEGMMIIESFDRSDQSQRYTSFRDSYRKRFDRDPVHGSLLGHDAGTVVMETLATRPPGMPMKEALLKHGPYTGLQRTIEFNPTGDNTTRSGYPIMIRDRQYVPER